MVMSLRGVLAACCIVAATAVPASAAPSAPVTLRATRPLVVDVDIRAYAEVDESLVDQVTTSADVAVLHLVRIGHPELREGGMVLTRLPGQRLPTTPYFVPTTGTRVNAPGRYHLYVGALAPVTLRFSALSGVRLIGRPRPWDPALTAWSAGGTPVGDGAGTGAVQTFSRDVTARTGTVGVAFVRADSDYSLTPGLVGGVGACFGAVAAPCPVRLYTVVADHCPCSVAAGAEGRSYRVQSMLPAGSAPGTYTAAGFAAVFGKGSTTAAVVVTYDVP
jgi:hypothetical protein